MKKCFYVNGNYDGNGCQDAIVVAAKDCNEAFDEAAKAGIKPDTIEEVPFSWEIHETKKNNIIHLERWMYIAGAMYPESFFE